MKKIIFLSLLIITSCGSINTDEENKKDDINVAKGVFITCEGGFNAGNASLEFYNSKTKVVDRSIFYNANDIPLGDVAYSFHLYDNKAFIVVNNSGKIYVTDKNKMTYEATISDLASPRHILFANSNKAYISDLFSPLITIFNPKTLKTIGSIDLGTNELGVNSSEDMVLVGNDLYVTSWSYNNKVYKIDTTNDKLVDSLEVGIQPSGMVYDGEDIWVISDGAYYDAPCGNEASRITQIKLDDFSIENQYISEDYSLMSKDLIYYEGSLYFGGQSTIDYSCGVYKMPIKGGSSIELPSSAFIKTDFGYLYGIGIDPKNGDIYLSNPLDFKQDSEIVRYDSTGKILDEFKVGIAASAFTFN